MSKSQTGVWIIIFFIAIIFFILIKQRRKKMSRRGGVGAVVQQSPTTIAASFPLPQSSSSGDDVSTYNVYIHNFDGTSPIQVEVLSTDVGEDLIRQVQSQLNRPVSLLMHRGRPLIREEPLSDQGIGSESDIHETPPPPIPTIIFKTRQYYVTKNRVRTMDRNPRINLIIIDVNSEEHIVTLKIPLYCLASQNIAHAMQWRSDIRQPNVIQLTNICNMGDITLVKTDMTPPLFDPDSISNIVFGPPLGGPQNTIWEGIKFTLV